MQAPEEPDFDRRFLSVEQDEQTGLYFFVLADDKHLQPLLVSWDRWATEADAFNQARQLTRPVCAPSRRSYLISSKLPAGCPSSPTHSRSFKHPLSIEV